MRLPAHSSGGVERPVCRKKTVRRRSCRPMRCMLKATSRQPSRARSRRRHRTARLALRDPAGVFLEDREHLLFLRNRLTLEKPPFHLIHLPPGVEKPLSIRQVTALSTHGICLRTSRFPSTSARQTVRYSSTSPVQGMREEGGTAHRGANPVLATIQGRTRRAPRRHIDTGGFPMKAVRQVMRGGLSDVFRVWLWSCPA